MPLTLRQSAMVAFGIALLPAGVIVYYVNKDLNAPKREFTPTGHNWGKPTIGDDRFALLTKYTRLYVESHEDATRAMREGDELAPPAFLNEKLEHEGVKWRVREVRGIVAVTYDVT